MSRPSSRDADPEVLSRTTLTALRRVLHAYREGRLLEGRLEAAARLAADDARLRGGGARPSERPAWRRHTAGVTSKRHTV